MKIILPVALFSLLAAGCVVSSPVPAYDPCVSTSECDVGLTCTTLTVDYGSYTSTGAICTNSCSSDLDCYSTASGYAGACYAIGSSPYICYERCASDYDCPSGYSCTDTVGGVGDAICLPN
ncbi:MAG: hypothetical protein GW913_05260 [Myxococcales bacterium]|nr:hypothetical protein [Myxococcales bacterium]